MSSTDAEQLAGRPLRIAALVKQVPLLEEMRLGPGGRLQREEVALEMNPYCRRAVSKGVELAATTGGTCTVVTLGPPAAEDCLREAIAWGADEGVLVSDPAFAGSDTLATARALATAIGDTAFDLVLVGRNSVDSDTGQVGPQLAELLGLAFVSGVRELDLDGGNRILRVVCQQDDGSIEATVTLPAVVSVAERLCDPCKVDPEGRAAVDAALVRRVKAAELGDGPWGQAGSPTSVGEVRVSAGTRDARILSGDVLGQVDEAVEILLSRGALADLASESQDVLADLVPVGGSAEGAGAVAVLVEPDRPRLTRELLGEAARLAAEVPGGGTVALAAADGGGATAELLASWGADQVVFIEGALVEEDLAAGAARWVERERPWGVLAPSTAWGREVASRVAARTGSGLTGDAVELDVDAGRLVAWKPAFGGQLVVAIRSASPTQMVTVRAGVLPLLSTRAPREIPVETVRVESRARVVVASRSRDDSLETLADATAVIGVGLGVLPSEYPLLDPLRAALGAELAATRKVTDRGWMPHSRQIGITGRSIAPRLYLAVGVGGKFTHMVGVRGAGTVLAVNSDPDALVFGACDIGIVADWREVLPLLVERIPPSGDRRPVARRTTV